MKLTTGRVAATLVILCAFGLVSGCSSKDDDKPKIRKKQGVAADIDVENRRVSMIITDKKGEDHEIEGTFTDETEVVINGRSQKIEDIREGDKVEVFGYSEGEGTAKKLIATKVIVTRDDNAEWKPTGKDSKKTEAQPPEKKAG